MEIGNKKNNIAMGIGSKHLNVNYPSDEKQKEHYKINSLFWGDRKNPRNRVWNFNSWSQQKWLTERVDVLKNTYLGRVLGYFCIRLPL